jgi:hypothetical protein
MSSYVIFTTIKVPNCPLAIFRGKNDREFHEFHLLPVEIKMEILLYATSNLINFAKVNRYCYHLVAAIFRVLKTELHLFISHAVNKGFILQIKAEVITKKRKRDVETETVFKFSPTIPSSINACSKVISNGVVFFRRPYHCVIDFLVSIHSLGFNHLCDIMGKVKDAYDFDHIIDTVFTHFQAIYRVIGAVYTLPAKSIIVRTPSFNYDSKVVTNKDCPFVVGQLVISIPGGYTMQFISEKSPFLIPLTIAYIKKYGILAREAQYFVYHYIRPSEIKPFLTRLGNAQKGGYSCQTGIDGDGVIFGVERYIPKFDHYLEGEKINISPRNEKYTHYKAKRT